MFDNSSDLFNNRNMTSRTNASAAANESAARHRRERVVAAAAEAGLLAGGRSPLGARLPQPLIEAAKARTGLTSTTEVVEYALAKVALEDDFGAKLVARKGRVPADLKLDV
jgi:hypothetical protein